MEKISSRELRFVDEKGRTRILSGINIADKSLNAGVFSYALDEGFFKKYRANGMDIIRLGVTWQNLEPAPGEYNEEYLCSLDHIFELAEKYGVYILLDMHQDLFSANGGKSGGDGAPEWAALSDGAKVRKPVFVWADGYFFGRWVSREFDNFWSNTPVGGKGIQDRYRDLWRMLAGRYGGSPALFGYDLMNEPFPGSESRKIFRKLVGGAAKAVLFGKNVDKKKLVRSAFRRDTKELLDLIGGDAVSDIVKNAGPLEARFDIEKYSPFINKTAEAIREVTPNGIIMMEQSYICNIGVKQSVPPVFVGGKRETNQCFGPHSYDIMVDTPMYKYANADRVKAFFFQMLCTQLRLNVPVIVGEWGGGGTDTSWFPHAYELLDLFDKNGWSQIYWAYREGDLDSPLMGLLRRTRPVAVAGMIKSYSYDRKSRVFTLVFDAEDDGETLIYVHKRFKKNSGFEYAAVEEYGNGSSLIAVRPVKGENTVSIQITE